MGSPRPKQLSSTSLRMTEVFPVPAAPVTITPRLVGRSEVRCSRTSPKSQFLPMKTGCCSRCGTSKKRGFKIHCCCCGCWQNWANWTEIEWWNSSWLAGRFVSWIPKIMGSSSTAGGPMKDFSCEFKWFQTIPPKMTISRELDTWIQWFSKLLFFWIWSFPARININFVKLLYV